MVKVIKKGELRQSMSLGKKRAQNENTRQIERNWLQVAKANIQAKKANDIALRFALFGR
jgi:hypothetical protein